MIALLQRVSRADVAVAGETVGAIDRGLLVFVAVQRADTRARAKRLAERVLAYRLFADSEGRMNLNVADAGGGLLLVPQFTLAADTASGNRPGFSHAAPPEQGRALFEHFVQFCRQQHSNVKTGRFGAHMQVTLTNDGPVTFWLEVASG